jgi:hypothetical protein
MSKLYDLRATLKADIIAADIGWADDSIIIKRQTDLWNDINTAIGAAKHGAVLHIGIASGNSTDDHSLDMALTMPITILCEPQITEDQFPEEDLWEALVKFIQGRAMEPSDSCLTGFRFKSFSDSEMELPGGYKYLARQTIFTKEFSLDD